MSVPCWFIGCVSVFRMCRGVGEFSKSMGSAPGGVFPNRLREGGVATRYPDSEKIQNPVVESHNFLQLTQQQG